MVLGDKDGMKQYGDSSRAYRIWIISTLGFILAAFVLLAAFTIYIDPFFHYHAPQENLAYPLSDSNARYQNDGILRHFTYDGVITGTSMAENFKTSEADQLFDANFIKVPFPGGRYKEVNDNLKQVWASGKDIKYVIRCLDYSMLVEDKDSVFSGTEYPEYLYDNDPLNDVNYLLNKEVLYKAFSVLLHTAAGGKTTDFDEYGNWSSTFSYGAEAILGYKLEERAETARRLTEDERSMILGNIRQNVTDLADKHPETIFYLFFSPYSICYWDLMDNSGDVDWMIDAEQVAIEELLKHSNIRLYSFCDNFDLVCNLDNYKDVAHYGEWVNSWILEWMREDQYLLTEQNYREYIDTIRDFYGSYDYDSLHTVKGEESRAV